jgi:hypothetical protein
LINRKNEGVVGNELLPIEQLGALSKVAKRRRTERLEMRVKEQVQNE